MSAAVPASVDRRPVFLIAALAAGVLCCQTGCLATKYKLAKKDTPPLQHLDLAFPLSPPLHATLAALISYGGPGSWKRQALWDEYIVTLENHGERALVIDTAVLVDSAGTAYASGKEPWGLEKQSKVLEKQYRDRGEAFMRAAAPGALIVGMGAATVSAAAGSSVFVSAGVVGAAAATVVVLPVYYLSVLGINHHNKKAVMREFDRRRLQLPLTLAPGETRTGSLFFPMVRNPGSLELLWAGEQGSQTAVLPLGFLQGLHVPPAPADQAPKQTLH